MLTPLIADVFRTRTLAEWTEHLEAHKVIAAAVRTVDEAAADPLAAANGCFTEVDHPEYGKFRTVAPPFRLSGFDLDKLTAVGVKVRDLFGTQCRNETRIHAVADDIYVADLATAVTGVLGGKVGVAPRVFLKKLVADVLSICTRHPCVKQARVSIDKPHALRFADSVALTLEYHRPHDTEKGETQ